MSPLHLPPPRHRREVVGDGTQMAGSCKIYPLKWRHHSRKRLVSGGLSQQLQVGITCSIEPWSCRGLLNHSRVKCPLQILAFIYWLVEWWSTSKAEPLLEGSDWFMMLEIVFMMLLLVIKKKRKHKTSFCHSQAVWWGQTLCERMLSERSPGGQAPLP